MNELIQVFNKYVKNYDLTKKELMGKYHHTFRVMENILELGKETGLSLEDMKLASTTALFHDIARFKQWTEYHTFSDSKSFDHGMMGKKILEEENLLHSFPENEKSIILNSILYHNKLDVPILDNKTNLSIDLIREADQLDIIKEQGLTISDNYKLNEKIVKSIYKNEIGNREDKKTNDDEILIMLSWILNFKFSYSYGYIEKYHILENKFHLLELYGEKEEVKKLKGFMLEELRKKGFIC